MDNLPDLTNLTLRDDSSTPHQFSGDFNSLTVPQLKAHCKLRGLKGYSKQLKRIIYAYNLLGDCNRRQLIEKLASYFLMMDIDYDFVVVSKDEDDDKEMSQFIID